jgi:O-antigen ligase
LALNEINQFFSMTQNERSAAFLGSTSIRLQYVITAWESIAQMNYWVGVGSLGFPQAYQSAAIALGVPQEAWVIYNWGNPHNEYLYMLASKGVVGLALYLAIFVQACRVAWHKEDEVQRIGLVMFVVLFMLSITANSMVIDMEEGHFAMFVLLVFLAPNSLNLTGAKVANS